MLNKKNNSSITRILSVILAVMLVVGLIQPVFAAPVTATEEPGFVPDVDYNFRDHTVDDGERVDEILSLMTLEEKLTMAMAGSAGAISRLGLNAGRSGSLEAVHGAMRSGKATVFPASLGMSQSFDKDMMWHVGEIIATESLASGQVGALSPILDITRDPRYGRAYETMGEDSYLIGSLGTQMTRGMSQRTAEGYLRFLPIAKHFMAYGNEINRLWTNSSIPLRALNEYYIRSFQMPVEDGSMKSLMTSYPLLNGKPISVSPLLDALLNEWTPDYADTGHYEYRTINDYGSGSSMWMHSQRYFPDEPNSRAFGSAQGLANGQMSWSFRNQTESNAQTGLNSAAQMYEALARGILSLEDVEENARRNLSLSMKMGDYDHLALQNPHFADMIPTRAQVIAAGRETALRASQEQIVLLKNDNNTLPLNGSSGAILLGSMGEDIMKDNYTGGSQYNITILHALQNKFGKDNVYYDRAIDTYAIKANNGNYLYASVNQFREPGASTAADIPIRATGVAVTDNDVQMDETNLLFEFYDFGDVYQELRTPINDLFVLTPQLVEAQANRGGLVNNSYGAGQGSAGVNETEWVNFMKFYIVPTDDGLYGIYTPVNGNGQINTFNESSMAHEDDEDVNNGTYFRLETSGTRINEIIANPAQSFVGPYRNENHVVGADITNSPFDNNGNDDVVDNLPADCKFDFQSVRSSTEAIQETVADAPAGTPIILVVGYEAHLNAREPVDVQYTGLSKQHMRNIDYLTNTLNQDIILVVKTNNPMTIDATVQNNPRVKSIIEIGHSGQEEGSALVSALFADGYSVPATGWEPTRDYLYSPYTVYSEYPGWVDADGKVAAYAPAGRLTTTWYNDVSDMLGASNDHAPASYRHPWYNETTNDNLSNLNGTVPTGILTYDIIKGERTYQYFKGTPLYEFGYGLTYTPFTYSNLDVSPVVNGVFTVSGSVTNSGSIISDEVVQIYSTFTGTPTRIVQPEKRLIAYDRLLSIAPGETRNFSLEVDFLKRLGVWDVEKEDYFVETGTYSIKMAKSSADAGISTTLTVTAANGGRDTSKRDLNRMVLAETFDDYSNISGDASDIELISSTIDYHSNTAVQFRKNGAWINFKNTVVPAGSTNLTLRVGADRVGSIKVYALPVGSDPSALATATAAATITLGDTRSEPGLPTGLGIGPFSVNGPTVAPFFNTPNPGSDLGQNQLDDKGYPLRYAYIKPEFETRTAALTLAAGEYDIYFVTEARGSVVEWLKFGASADTSASLEINNIYLLDSIREKNGTLPLRAALNPVTSADSVAWSVTDLDGAATTLATISADGVLTATGTANGKVLVTAASGSITGSREFLVTNQLDSNKVTISGNPKTIDYLIMRTGTAYGANDNIQRLRGTSQQTVISAELFSENVNHYYFSSRSYLTIPAAQLIYSISAPDGSPTDLATVSATGLVTAAGVGDGDVVVTATLINNPDITASRTIKLQNQGLKNPFKMIQAENYDTSSATLTASAAWARGGNEQGLYVASTAAGTRAGYANVDFGNTIGSDRIYVRVASTAASNVAVWIDNYTEALGGTQVGSMALTSTGATNMYKTYSAPLNQVVTGVHDLYLVFSGAATRINWFQFTESDNIITLSGPDSVVSGSGATASYTLKAVNMDPLSGIDFSITVDGSYLSSKEFAFENGFAAVSAGNYSTPLFWTNVGDVWTGKAVLYNGNPGGISGDFDIFTMTFNVAEGKLGPTDVVLNYATTSYGGSTVESDIVNGTVTTELTQWYSPYDLNKDGVIDLNDVTFALQYLLVTDSDPEWEQAKVCNFATGGAYEVIDINDLIIILANYTIPYYS